MDGLEHVVGTSHLFHLFGYLVSELLCSEEVGKDDASLQLCLRGIAHERIAATDIEIDIGQGVEPKIGSTAIGIDHGYHLEEESELGYFGSFDHDIDSI